MGDLEVTGTTSRSVPSGGHDPDTVSRMRMSSTRITSRVAGATAVGALTLVLMGCGSTGGDAADGGADPVGTWGAGGEGQPQIELTQEGTFAGTDGCNQLGGEWEAEGAEVTFGPARSTMKFCEGVDTWLAGLATATVTSDSMTVFDNTGAEIGTLARGS